MAIFVFKWVKDNTGIVLASFGFMNLHPYTKQGYGSHLILSICLEILNYLLLLAITCLIRDGKVFMQIQEDVLWSDW